MKIYHYTTIEALVAILSNKTIKFSRLDTVDDLDEGRIEFKGTPLSHIFFASSWSKDKDESISMWKLYTRDGIGVRIGLDSDSLFDNPVEKLISTIMSFEGENNNTVEDTESAIRELIFDAMGGKHYNDTVIIMQDSVNYVTNPLTVVKQAIVPYEPTNNAEGLMFSNRVIAFTKDISWSFQQEYRFLKIIFPRDHKTASFQRGKNFNTSWSETYQLLIDGQEPESAPGIPLKEIFVPVKQDAFSEIEIILGPNCNETHKLIVESICEKLGIKTDISRSCLTGRVRFK